MAADWASRYVSNVREEVTALAVERGPKLRIGRKNSRRHSQDCWSSKGVLEDRVKRALTDGAELLKFGNYTYRMRDFMREEQLLLYNGRVLVPQLWRPAVLQ